MSVSPRCQLSYAVEHMLLTHMLLTCVITREAISHQGINDSIMYLYYLEGKFDKVLVKCSDFGASIQMPVMPLIV